MSRLVNLRSQNIPMHLLEDGADKMRGGGVGNPPPSIYKALTHLSIISKEKCYVEMFLTNHLKLCSFLEL